MSVSQTIWCAASGSIVVALWMGLPGDMESIGWYTTNLQSTQQTPFVEKSR
jgi:hypothetical protein